MAYIEKITVNLQSFLAIVQPFFLQLQSSSLRNTFSTLRFSPQQNVSTELANNRSPGVIVTATSSRENLHYVTRQCESFFIVFLYNVDGDDAHYNAL